ncbi:MAG: DUF2271 domain-containing protein [Planctomycetes bacterium]|nr:DUF2271 domain-containing protein [Planctomycetota bacterium]
MLSILARPSPALLSWPLALTIAAAAIAQAPQGAATGSHDYPFAREGVLGTSSQLAVTAPDEATAERAAEALFAEVARLEQQLSLWREDSDLARLVAAGGGKAEGAVLEVLRSAEQWQKTTGGAFEPGVAVLTGLWQRAAQDGHAPTEAQLREALATVRQPSWSLQGAELTVHHAFTIDALAKGFVVDAACRTLQKFEHVALLSFQIGGDVRLGDAAHEVDLVDPRHPADNAAPLLTVRLAGRAVATSGGYARGFDIAGKHHSHILDPRTGRPCDGVLGASVLAADVATADVLATSLCVLGPEEGFELLRRVPGAHAVVVTADGKVHRSPGLGEFVVDRPSPTVTETTANGGWPKGYGLQVAFELQQPDNSDGRRRGGWKRPYVAVWIEDATGTPARTLCLWIENRRWLRDLRRWSRQNGDQPDLIDVVSQATRKAGKYTLTWDGTDDSGRRLAPGTYTLYIEAAREHGTYQLAKTTLELRTERLDVALDDNAEVGGMHVTFGPLRQKDD